MNDFLPTLSKVSMSEESFERFSNFISGNFGIKMPLVKKTMLESRLQKRLRKLGLASFEEYEKYLFTSEGMREELFHMIDQITTNKTDFFREPAQFEYLIDVALPKLIESRGSGVKRPLKVWSAGCSSGEEPYTLAMVLLEFAEGREGFDFSILGTDISREVLEKALRGVYREHLVEPVAEPLRRKYLMRSRSREKDLVRIVPELRSKVSYLNLNLMDEEFGIDDSMDMVFCRNVIIYFDRPTQKRLIRKLCRHLVPEGYLFLGHSETLHSMKVPLVQVAPMIYQLAS